MPWHRSLLSLLCTLPLAVHAAEPLSLEEAVGRALEIAPQVSAQTANLEALQALTASAGRLPDPELIVGIDNLPVTGADAYSTTRDFMTMRKVGVMQTFPAATKRKLRSERAAAEADVAQAELLGSRLAVAREVAQAWIRRAIAEASLSELRALESEVELQASAARAAVAAGRSSTAQALAAQAAVAQFHTRLLRLQSEARQATFELARWIESDAARPLAAMPGLDELPTPPAALLASVHEHGSLLTFEPRRRSGEGRAASRLERRARVCEARLRVLGHGVAAVPHRPAPVHEAPTGSADQRQACRAATARSCA
jgi:cobalt-zinc-cadmium efflux system outer membrane protein